MPFVYEEFLIKQPYLFKNVILYIQSQCSFSLKKQSTMNNQRQENLKNAHLSHRESMRKSLTTRLSAARATGDEKLVKQLEAEAKYLHL